MKEAYIKKAIRENNVNEEESKITEVKAEPAGIPDDMMLDFSDSEDECIETIGNEDVNDVEEAKDIKYAEDIENAEDEAAKDDEWEEHDVVEEIMVATKDQPLNLNTTPDDFKQFIESF